MAVVSMCLKCLFIGLNIIYIILAGVVFALALVLNSYIQAHMQDTAALEYGWIQAPVWLLGFGILIVASLGIHGARKESKWPLISFITASVIGLTIMLLNGSQFAKAKIMLSQARIGGDGMFDGHLWVCFGLAALTLSGIIMAAIILRQLLSQQPNKY